MLAQVLESAQSAPGHGRPPGASDWPSWTSVEGLRSPLEARHLPLPRFRSPWRPPAEPKERRTSSGRLAVVRRVLAQVPDAGVAWIYTARSFVRPPLEPEYAGSQGAEDALSCQQALLSPRLDATLLVFLVRRGVTKPNQLPT